MPVDVVDIPFFNGSLSEAITQIADACLNEATKSNRLVKATSAHDLIMAQRDHAFTDLLRCFHVNLADGMRTALFGEMNGPRL